MINLHCLRLSRREGPFPQTPVREHAVNNTACSTCSAAGVYCTIFKYIRRFNMIMCAGLEPDKTAMSPNARKAQTIHNKFTKVVFLNTLRDPEQYAGCDAIRIGPPRVLSGCQRKTKLRELLKDSLNCNLVRDPGYCKNGKTASAVNSSNWNSFQETFGFEFTRRKKSL